MIVKKKKEKLISCDDYLISLLVHKSVLLNYFIIIRGNISHNVSSTEIMPWANSFHWFVAHYKGN